MPRVLRFDRDRWSRLVGLVHLEPESIIFCLLLCLFLVLLHLLSILYTLLFCLLSFLLFLLGLFLLSLCLLLWSLFLLFVGSLCFGLCLRRLPLCLIKFKSTPFKKSLPKSRASKHSKEAKWNSETGLWLLGTAWRCTALLCGGKIWRGTRRRGRWLLLLLRHSLLLMLILLLWLPGGLLYPCRNRPPSLLEERLLSCQKCPFNITTLKTFILNLDTSIAQSKKLDELDLKIHCKEALSPPAPGPEGSPLPSAASNKELVTVSSKSSSPSWSHTKYWRVSWVAKGCHRLVTLLSGGLQF